MEHSKFCEGEPALPCTESGEKMKGIDLDNEGADAEHFHTALATRNSSALRSLRKGDTFTPGSLTFKVTEAFRECCVVSPEIFCQGELERRKDDVDGVWKQMAQIHEVIELLVSYSELFTSVDVKAPEGIMLPGPSGSGKALIVRDNYAGGTNEHFQNALATSNLAALHETSNEAMRETLMAARIMFIIFAMLVLGCHSVFATIFGKIHIDVENIVLPKADVKLHCKSKNNDLGNHVIPPSRANNFTFHDNLWDMTLFYCYVQWKRPDGKWVKGTFKIYEPKRDLRRCMHRCKWQIHAKGIFSFTLDTKQWKNLYKDFNIEDRASSPNNAPPSAYSSFVFITLVLHFLFIVYK